MITVRAVNSCFFFFFLLQDSVVRCHAWAEMSVTLLEAMIQEDDATFQKILPIFYENIVVLVAGSGNSIVRAFIVKLLKKLPKIYEIRVKTVNDTR